MLGLSRSSGWCVRWWRRRRLRRGGGRQRSWLLRAPGKPAQARDGTFILDVGEAEAACVKGGGVDETGRG